MKNILLRLYPVSAEDSLLAQLYLCSGSGQGRISMRTHRHSPRSPQPQCWCKTAFYVMALDSILPLLFCNHVPFKPVCSSKLLAKEHDDKGKMPEICWRGHTCRAWSPNALASAQRPAPLQTRWTVVPDGWERTTLITSIYFGALRGKKRWNCWAAVLSQGTWGLHWPWAHLQRSSALQHPQAWSTLICHADCVAHTWNGIKSITRLLIDHWFTGTLIIILTI